MSKDDSLTRILLDLSKNNHVIKLIGILNSAENILFNLAKLVSNGIRNAKFRTFEKLCRNT